MNVGGDDTFERDFWATRGVVKAETVIKEAINKKRTEREDIMVRLNSFSVGKGCVEGLEVDMKKYTPCLKRSIDGQHRSRMIQQHAS